MAGGGETVFSELKNLCVWNKGAGEGLHPIDAAPRRRNCRSGAPTPDRSVSGQDLLIAPDDQQAVQSYLD
jgi:hypothetical protein